MGDQQEIRAPRVFISHASEDKDRFVRGFAERLRQNGVEAWLDEWELRPGDKLVQRIFTHGIGQADVFVVVLTANSIDKPWVQKELDVGVVRQIEDSTRLIPIVFEIQDDRIPEALRDTLWQRISELSNYDSEFDRILRAIYGSPEKPPLGAPPAYVLADATNIEGFAREDSLVLKALGLAAIAEYSLLPPEPVVAQAQEFGLSAEAVYEALEVFEQQGLVELQHVGGQREPAFVRLLPSGSACYFSAYREDYAGLKRRVAAAVVNDGCESSFAMAEHVGEPHSVVIQIIDILASEGHLRAEIVSGGERIIHHPSPSLKRLLR